MSFPFNKDAASKLLADTETFSFTLMTILLAAYGEEVFEEDETAVLFTNLEEDFRCTLSEETENKINAALTVMTTDLFYTNPNVFTATALAFTDGDIGDIPTGVMEEIDAPAALWTIFEVSLINGDEAEDTPELFTPAVKQYVDSLIASEAIDLDQVDSETDTTEEAFQEPYYQQYVNTKIKELARQLKVLGCPPIQIQTLLDENQLTLDDEEEEED